MQIAITADIHLKTHNATPNRYKALQNILDQIIEQEISELIIAGDLFDADATNYSEFERLLGDTNYSSINTTIIRGNHDIGLRNEAFIGENINVVDDPEIITFEDSNIPFLFIPYDENLTMGEVIADYADKLPKNNWILIGHGDYLETVKDPDAYEVGTYMPLSRSDVNQFKPFQAFLGHIHKPMEIGDVTYVGSPFPIQINETGPRRFIVFDTRELTSVSQKVKYGHVNFIEELMVLPTDNEEELVAEQLEKIVEDWKSQQINTQNVNLRLNVYGYSKGRKDLYRFIEDKLSQIGIGKIDNLNFEELNSIEAEPEKIKLANLALDYMSTQDWDGDDVITPSRREVMQQIQKVIFEV